jgi:hypothetical protein
MKRLVAMLLMIAFAWGGVITASHAVDCDDSGAISVSVEKADASHPAKAPGDNDIKHCAAACHAGSASIPLAANVASKPIPAVSAVLFSDVGSTSHVLAVPTPPPSLS